METVINKPKNARWGQKKTEGNIQIASNSVVAHGIFGGKTLEQVGGEYDLADEDLTWGYSINPNTQEKIRSLTVRINGVKWAIPVSRKIGDNEFDNPEILRDCMFRLSHLSVRNEDGTPKTDENNRPVVDETKPYLSFGRPSGLKFVEEEAVFTEPATIPEA